jgi:hypothetical protein
LNVNATVANDASHRATAVGVTGAEQNDESPCRELAGTSWRLVKIMSTDDSVYATDAASRYTLIFCTDGTADILADCNHGTGTWTSTFATKAPCPSGSLSEQYLALSQWVRSYVLKSGHLYLATMADGSIIEFEPIERTLAATVLGEEVHTSNAGEMQGIVLTRLFDRYAGEEGIAVAETEIDAYVDNLRRGMRAEGLTAEGDLTPEEAAEVERMRRDMGRAMIRQWKLSRALHRQYGGRIIFRQLGPEPSDAYRQYLEERQAAGDLEIRDKAFEHEFWRYFTDDSIHSFYPSGSEEEARAFAIPPWERMAEAE